MFCSPVNNLIRKWQLFKKTCLFLFVFSLLGGIWAMTSTGTVSDWHILAILAYRYANNYRHWSSLGKPISVKWCSANNLQYWSILGKTIDRHYGNLYIWQYVGMHWQYRGRCICGSDQCLHQGAPHSPFDHRHVFGQNCKCCLFTSSYICFCSY